MVRRLLLLSLMAAAALFVVSACGGLSGGLSEQQAVSKATTQAQQMSSTRVTLVSAVSGRLGDLETGGGAYPNPNTEVWAVTFDGTFPAVSCGPAVLPGQPSHACPVNTSTRIFLNYTSGALVMAVTPATG
jgi:hypothetical protein